MSKPIDLLCRFMEGLIAAALAIMVVLVFGNVVLRYGFNSGIMVSEELSRWLFVWLIFLGAIVTLKEHTHLGTDFVISRLPVRGKKACLVAGHAIMLFVTWVLFDGALAQSKLNLNVTAAVTGASMALFYGAGVVFSVAAAGLLFYDLWFLVTGKLKDDQLVMVTESEEQAELEALQKELGRTDIAEIGSTKKPEGGSK